MTARNILLVDDDKTSNFICGKVLTRLGVVNELHTALNGRDALDQLRQRPSPEIIFVDLNMPVMDGFQFIEAFAKLDPAQRMSTRLVVLTSSEAPEDIQRVKALGVKDYLVKPIKEADVLRIFV